MPKAVNRNALRQGNMSITSIKHRLVSGVGHVIVTSHFGETYHKFKINKKYDLLQPCSKLQIVFLQSSAKVNYCHSCNFIKLMNCCVFLKIRQEIDKKIPGYKQQRLIVEIKRKIKEKEKFISGFSQDFLNNVEEFFLKKPSLIFEMNNIMNNLKCFHFKKHFSWKTLQLFSGKTSKNLT